MKAQKVEFWVDDYEVGGRRLGVAVYFPVGQVLIERGHTEPYLTGNDFRAYRGSEAKAMWKDILDGEVECRGEVEWGYEKSGIAKAWIKGQEELDLVGLLQKPL
jgi:hypothetical protein